jgi:hypothetical protein
MLFEPSRMRVTSLEGAERHGLFLCLYAPTLQFHSLQRQQPSVWMSAATQGDVCATPQKVQKSLVVTDGNVPQHAGTVRSTQQQAGRNNSNSAFGAGQAMKPVQRQGGLRSTGRWAQVGTMNLALGAAQCCYTHHPTCPAQHQWRSLLRVPRHRLALFTICCCQL